MEARAVSADVSLDGSTLIIGVLDGLEPLPGSEELFGHVDSTLLEAAGFEGKQGQALVVPHEVASSLLIVGVGQEVSYDSLKTASGDAVRKVRTARAVTYLAQVGLEGATRAVTEGSLLGSYQFRAYKTDGDPLQIESIEVVDGEADQVADAVAVCDATMLAREWVNTPARDKSPESLANLVSRLAREVGLEVEVWERERIEEENLGGVLGVAAGSDRDPRVVILKHRPDGAKKHLALVGKGITFDSGGLSIKPASSMEEMKDDMSGAAAAMAATIGIARLRVPVSVTTIAPLTDNAIGGDATRPGDVLRPVEGPTIEVLNTDAEGRLILADGLGLAKRYDPDMTVDIATLTGAASVALGKQIGAVFGSDSDVSKTVLEAAGRAGELFWELPLHMGYRKSLDSNIADVKNISNTRYGGAIVAAVFLAEYAGDGPWAHLDIAGPARSEETSGEFVKGASGVGVRTLIELARSLGEPR